MGMLCVFHRKIINHVAFCIHKCFFCVYQHKHFSVGEGGSVLCVVLSSSTFD